MICLFACFICSGLKAQNQIIGKSIPELKAVNPLPFVATSPPLFLFWSKYEIADLPTFAYARHQKTPSVYAYKELGVFCRLDVRLEKRAGFPIKFRLGEVQYVEKMEGK